MASLTCFLNYIASCMLSDVLYIVAGDRGGEEKNGFGGTSIVSMLPSNISITSLMDGL
ncbi:hypothetical protein HanXRQr2_Chr17g0813891 [Helianthus annuus]|uniref:Uncharacterized protein n=1 Tax=Helianthus annuus TaxID=4232 RepID=A0A9K3GVD0_HELAN|nr:hypothetical protein HanXRQr2_Chr17g0813891 [Helianthus annuus]